MRLELQQCKCSHWWLEVSCAHVNNSLDCIEVYAAASAKSHTLLLPGHGHTEGSQKAVSYSYSVYALHISNDAVSIIPKYAKFCHLSPPHVTSAVQVWNIVCISLQLLT
jgi:hypothetical protein